MADTLELQPELREKMIYRRYIKQKYTEKKAQGWDEVHKAIKSAPYCARNQQISNIFFCCNCMNRARTYRCILCHRKGKCHYLKYPGFNKNDYDECFIRIYPYDMSWCDKLRYIYLHYKLD